MQSLLSYGEALVDFLPMTSEQSAYIPLAGGAPANVAVAYAKLSGESYFAGGISQDNFGSLLLKELRHQGVNTRYVNIVDDANTALVLVSLDDSGERSFNFYRDNTADTQFDVSDIDSIDWKNIHTFHYCSNTLTELEMYENTLYAVKKAKMNNCLVSFDVNLRQQLWQDLSLLPQRVEACLKQSDIVKLSKDEAIYLADAKQLTISSYIDFLLSLNVKLVVITDGPNPITLTTSCYSVSVNVPIIKAIDTTAAGDSFIAGFLYYLIQLDSIQTTGILSVIKEQDMVILAAEFGSKCGAHTCQKKGAFKALPLITDL